jgi:hypothetical protein
MNTQIYLIRYGDCSYWGEKWTEDTQDEGESCREAKINLGVLFFLFFKAKLYVPSFGRLRILKLILKKKLLFLYIKKKYFKKQSLHHSKTPPFKSESASHTWKTFWIFFSRHLIFSCNFIF